MLFSGIFVVMKTLGISSTSKVGSNFTAAQELGRAVKWNA